MRNDKPGPIAVRRARPDDLAAAAGVHCEAALTAYRTIFPSDAPKPTPGSLLPEWVALQANPATTIVIAVERGRVVGCAAVAPDEAVPSGLVLARLYVHPSKWNAGIGSLLHDAALSVAAERGAASINLWVLEANRRAREMYERRGWRLVVGPTKANIVASVLDVLYERPVSSPDSGCLE